MKTVRAFETSITMYRSFVSSWPMEFSSGSLEASLCYSDGDSGLADETKEIYFVAASCIQYTVYSIQYACPPAQVNYSRAKD